jgi:hypothetical protein
VSAEERASAGPARELVRVPDRLYAGYVFDLDGTIYLGCELLPGAGRLVQALRDMERKVVFVSNNPTRDPEDYARTGRPTLHADYENVKALTQALSGHQAIPVAVGSGTINDIVKRASHESERPYMAVGTAASMDGYTSFGASITKDGQGVPTPEESRRERELSHAQ